MPTTSSRTTVITNTGDFLGTQYISAASNTDASGEQRLITLANGNNTITLPTNVVVRSITVIPPSGNTTAITLRGVAGDTGIRVHNTDPFTISFDTSVTTFVINVAAEVVDVRIVYT